MEHTIIKSNGNVWVLFGVMIGASFVVVADMHLFPLRAKVRCQLTVPFFVLSDFYVCFVLLWFYILWFGLSPLCEKRLSDCCAVHIIVVTFCDVLQRSITGCQVLPENAKLALKIVRGANWLSSSFKQQPRRVAGWWRRCTEGASTYNAGNGVAADDSVSGCLER